jgi:hypothetical protein
LAIRPPSLPRQLLGALSELRLERDVPRTLDGSQKRGEVLLLRFHCGDSLLLNTQRGVQQIAHPLLVRGVSGYHLLSELLPDLPLLHPQLPQLRSEFRIRLFEFVELRVRQSQSLLGEPGGAFPELLLESGPISLWCGAGGLRVEQRRQADKCENRESKRWLHHYKS